MARYITQRLFQAAVTLFILSIIFFVLVRARGGTPCGAYNLGCNDNLHTDEPLVNQYLFWMGGILHGDFGTTVYGQSVSALILEKLPPTIVLVVVSLSVQQLIALPLGILSALRPYSLLDQVLTFLSYFFLSLPAFLFGFFLIYLLGVYWNILPVGHYEDVALPLLWSHDWFAMLHNDPGLILGDLVRHLILPVFVLAVTGIAIDSRFMRSSMLQVLHEDYIRTARAKGLPRRRVVLKHAFRNALLPILTNLALYLPAFISGAVVVETVFTWGGLGYAFSQAIEGIAYGAGDFPTVQALVMLSAVAVVIANLLADLAYAWLDPRIRFAGQE